jgi:hypothetical protein
MKNFFINMWEFAFNFQIGALYMESLRIFTLLLTFKPIRIFDFKVSV